MATLTKADLLKLDVAQRLELIEELWDSIASDPDAPSRLPLTDEERALIEDRLREHQASPDSARPWAEVRADLEPPMSFQLVVEPAAASDIADADAHYAHFDKATAFISAVDDVFANLTNMPLMYPAVLGDVRRALLRRFPFSVFFLVKDERVIVLAVHHQRRGLASRTFP